MPVTVTDRSTFVEVNEHSYSLTRVIETCGYIVRVFIDRWDNYEDNDAFAEVRTDTGPWLNLFDVPDEAWIPNTAEPSDTVDVTAALGPLAERLIARACNKITSFPPPNNHINARERPSPPMETQRVPQPTTPPATHGSALSVVTEPRTRCPDCDAAIGETHLDECDVARCTVSGFQYLMCEFHQESGVTAPHDACGKDTWTGWWPGTEDCQRLGWMIHPSIPGLPSLPDLNRLYTEATWDPDRREFVPRPKNPNSGDTTTPTQP